MNNSEKGDFYFGISDTKIYICFFEKGKNKYSNIVKFDIPDSLLNNLNFKIIQKLLKENIRELEKRLGFFLNDGNISIQSKSYQSILFSVKNIFDEQILDKKIVTNLLQSAIQQFDNNEKNLCITHIIINKFVIDDRVYKYLPNEIKFKKIVLEIEFICLDEVLVNKVKKLFNECKININKIVSYDYAKRFLISDRDDTMCISANKVLNGENQSEVYLTESQPKKISLFNQIFGLFD
tara:strand:- start:165 stop:875 length:711 start_codon:yes stop_codon:yes gene_type:complete